MDSRDFWLIMFGLSAGMVARMIHKKLLEKKDDCKCLKCRVRRNEYTASVADFKSGKCAECGISTVTESSAPLTCVLCNKALVNEPDDEQSLVAKQNCAAMFNAQKERQ